jgi:sporulation protein YlmC with PRC-barrel domain
VAAGQAVDACGLRDLCSTVEKELLVLEPASALRRYRIEATDGDIGRVVDVLFDDERWTTRYFVVETGGWMGKRRVLISPIAVRSLDERERVLRIELTRDQVANSPSVDTHVPLSRQAELRYRDYFAWPLYWVETYVDAYDRAAFPQLAAADQSAKAGSRPRRESMLERAPQGDPHLRSAREVSAYAVMATDGRAGQVLDLAIDSGDWEVRSLIVRATYRGEKTDVVVSPDAVRDLNVVTSAIHIDRSRREIRQSPHYQMAS